MGDILEYLEIPLSNLFDYTLPKKNSDSYDSAIEQSDFNINRKLKFLSKIHKMRAILQQSFNVFLDP